MVSSLALPGLKGEAQHHFVVVPPLPHPSPTFSCPSLEHLGGASRAQVRLDRALGTWNGCWALGAFSEPTPEQREKQPGSTHKQRQSKETERQKFRGQSPIKMEKGVKMLPGCRASKCMEPSVQSLSHSWINVRLMASGHAAGLGSALNPSHYP